MVSLVVGGVGVLGAAWGAGRLNSGLSVPALMKFATALPVHWLITFLFI